MSLPTIIAFVSASLVLAFAPGPDNIFVLTQSAVHGWRESVVVTLGLCAGLIVHTAAVALGAAVIFQQSELAFTALKIAGALYLLYLAYGAFKAGPATLKLHPDRQSGRGLRASREGWIRAACGRHSPPRDSPRAGAAHEFPQGAGALDPASLRNLRDQAESRLMGSAKLDSEDRLVGALMNRPSSAPRYLTLESVGQLIDVPLICCCRGALIGPGFSRKHRSPSRQLHYLVGHHPSMVLHSVQHAFLADLKH